MHPLPTILDMNFDSRISLKPSSWPAPGSPGTSPAFLPPNTATPHPPRWHSRGYLPHFDSTQVIQSITFRLADSLPQEKLYHFAIELAARKLDPSAEERERRRQIERWLDAGMGCCALRHPAMGAVMEETLLRFDPIRYRLLAWCIMPNHVHVLIEPIELLGKIVQSWKSYTGRWAVQHSAKLGLGVRGNPFWMREYWDRYIRNGEHLAQVIRYIHQNPVKAGLCAAPEDWRWSSAHLQHGGGTVANGSTAGGRVLLEKCRAGARRSQAGASISPAQAPLHPNSTPLPGNAEPQLGSPTSPPPSGNAEPQLGPPPSQPPNTPNAQLPAP